MSDLPADPPATVNKTDMAGILRTSVNTLDKLLRQHGDAFPIVTRGTNGVPYAFDPAAVLIFLQDIETARSRAGAAKDELMQQYTLPDVIPSTDTALTPRDRYQLARLRVLERDEQLKAGFLVETAAVRAALYAAFATLRRDMTAAVRQSLRDANIPEAVIRAVEARIADAQRTFVDTAKNALAHATDPNDGAEPTFL